MGAARAEAEARTIHGGVAGQVAKIVGMECKMEVLQEDVNKLDGKFAVHHDMSHTECRQAMVLK